MITVGIPTIWLAKNTLDLSILSLESSLSVQEIILVNNKKEYNICQHNSIVNSRKIVVYTPTKNIYVSKSWNWIVDNSTTELVCLLNDDIFIKAEIFDWIANNWPKNCGLLGLCEDAFKIDIQQQPTITKSHYRTLGYGQMLVFKRINYEYIPGDINIWYNDDYLYHKMRGQHYQLNCGVLGGMSTSTFSDPDFEAVKRADAIAYKKYIG
jgi:hypothetical protein